MFNTHSYDYIIVGAGISGLYTAYNLYKKYPRSKICILEATQYIGGRLHSIKYDGLIMDGGGARFNTQQHRIISLIKELDLWNKVVPISGTTIYKPVYNSLEAESFKSLESEFSTIDDFIIFMKKYIKEKKIKREELINTNILDFAVLHFNKKYPNIKKYLINLYPYYSELGVLNAVEGLKLFSNEFSDKTKYFILNGGLEQLAETLYNKLKKISHGSHGTIDIFKETPVLNINININEELYLKNSHITYIITTENNGNKKQFTTNKLILTIPKNKLLKITIKINSIKNKQNKINIKNKLDKLHYNINSVQNEPLYRIYARYPLDKTTNKVWFDGIDKISTNLPIKYIIPVNYDKGVIMISYTDSKFAKYWLSQVINDTFETTLNKQLKQLFPDIDIPKAKWFKHCPWVSGAGYWKKGYDRKIIMPQMIEPLGHHKNLYICGENYSSHQAWVEGSLETSDMVLDKIYKYRHLVNNLVNKTKYKSNMYSKKNISNISNISNIKHKMKTKKNISISRSRSRTNTNTKTKSKSNSKSNKKTEYTIEEVAKHNKKSDAWIIIHNKVADITSWIPKHPGGNIIMKGVGKDATQLFDSIGHDDYAKSMLKKYQIGILKK